MISAGERKVGP